MLKEVVQYAINHAQKGFLSVGLAQISRHPDRAQLHRHIIDSLSATDNDFYLAGHFASGLFRRDRREGLAFDF